MSIIGQVQRAIRREAARKLKKYEYEHRTRIQKIPLTFDVKGNPLTFKEVTHFPPKKEEEGVQGN